jgi:hypothetical protein
MAVDAAMTEITAIHSLNLFKMIEVMTVESSRHTPIDRIDVDANRVKRRIISYFLFEPEEVEFAA